MRFERVQIEAFGRLRNLDTGGPLASFVVVEGPNEAGKSTFFEMLVALLYGFYPASRERNPYAPWNDTPASGQALLRLDGGGCLDVRRRLLSSPSGLVTRGEEEASLRNETLEVAAHVPMTVYRQVFALTLTELAALQAEGWDAVQDRLLGALGARDLVPARKVADELEERAGTLWRPNRRGNQRVRALDIEMRELTNRRSDLRRQEQDLRDKHHRLGVQRARLAELKARRNATRDRLEHAHRLAPIRDGLARIADLRSRAGPPEALEGLPTDPPQRLKALREELARATAESERLERELERLEREAGALDDGQRTLLALADEIAALAADARAADGDRVRLGRLEQEAQSLTRRVEALLVPLGLHPPIDRQAVRALPLHALRPAVAAVRQANRSAEAVTSREQRARARLDRLPSATAWLALGALALALLTVTLLIGRPVLAVGASVVLGAAAAGLLVRARVASSERPSADERAQLERARADARERLRAVLAPVLAPPADADTLEALPSVLERVHDLLGDLEDREAATQAIHAANATLRERAAELARRAGRDPGSREGTATSIAARLDQALASARQTASAATLAEREAERVRERRHRAVTERSRLAEELHDLERRLTPLGGGDAGAREAAARIRARERARELHDDLVESYSEQELAEARIPDDDPAGVEALAREEHGLTDEIEALSHEALALEGDLARLSHRTTLDALDGEIAALADERARLIRERDRLWVLARVVREAERWVREEHQPELLRRASALLETLTGGRYERIVLDPSGRGFRVRGPATPRSLPVEPPLSTGTREQIYLALRLALLDTLDGSGERLPVALDEVLVNWDGERRARGLDLLAELAERRQVFLMTCHREIARAAAERGAMHVVLSGPGGS